MGQFSSVFAAYLSALSLWQTPLTVRHRVIGLSMGRKLWPWAQSERIWLSGVSCEPPLNYKDWALTRLFKGASYTTTVSAFPSWGVVFHSAYYDQVWSGLYTGSIYPLGWGYDRQYGGRARVYGMLSEFPPFNPDLTMPFLPRILGLPQDEVQTLLSVTVSSTDLPQPLPHHTWFMSSGQGSTIQWEDRTWRTKVWDTWVVGSLSN